MLMRMTPIVNNNISPASVKLTQRSAAGSTRLQPAQTQVCHCLFCKFTNGKVILQGAVSAPIFLSAGLCSKGYWTGIQGRLNPV